MALLLASFNPHKIREVRAILSPLGLKVVGLDEIPDPPEAPEESGDTFGDNARLKAVACARALARPCLADDSGLVVDCLGGDPGVRSARYAGAEGTRAQRDAANNALLLRETASVPMVDRAARFVCAMCLVRADGSILAETEGTFEGIVADEPRGTGGFGYDPLFWVPDACCTSAELTPDQKHARSHRGEALRRMATRITDLAEGGLL